MTINPFDNFNDKSISVTSTTSPPKITNLPTREWYSTHTYKMAEVVTQSGYIFNGEEKSKFANYPSKEIVDESYHGAPSKNQMVTRKKEPYNPPVTVFPKCKSKIRYKLTISFRRINCRPGNQFAIRNIYHFKD